MRALTRALDRAVLVVAALLVVVLLACVALGVVTRGLGNPLIWTDELSRFVMVWLAAFGWAAATRRRIHVRIRYFQDKLPRLGGRGVELLIQLAMASFGALVAWEATDLVRKNHDLEATTLPIMIAWMYVPLILAGLVTCVQALAEAGEVVRAMARGDAAVARAAEGDPS